MTNSVNIVPFEVVNGLDGKPLTNGKVYIGQPNQDPEQYPVTLYWDAAGTIPAAQPIRTVGGYISRRGTPAQLYVNGNYSLRVRTANNVQVYYVPDVLMIDSGQPVTKAELAAIGGAALVGFQQDGAGAIYWTLEKVGRIQNTPEQFGCVGDGVSDDTVNFRKAVAASSKKSLVCNGKYLINTTTESGITITSNNINITGNGEIIQTSSNFSLIVNKGINNSISLVTLSSVAPVVTTITGDVAVIPGLLYCDGTGLTEPMNFNMFMAKVKNPSKMGVVFYKTVLASMTKCSISSSEPTATFTNTAANFLVRSYSSARIDISGNDLKGFCEGFVCQAYPASDYIFDDFAGVVGNKARKNKFNGNTVSGQYDHAVYFSNDNEHYECCNNILTVATDAQGGEGACSLKLEGGFFVADNNEVNEGIQLRNPYNGRVTNNVISIYSATGTAHNPSKWGILSEDVIFKRDIENMTIDGNTIVAIGGIKTDGAIKVNAKVWDGYQAGIKNLSVSNNKCYGVGGLSSGHGATIQIQQDMPLDGGGAVTGKVGSGVSVIGNTSDMSTMLTGDGSYGILLNNIEDADVRGNRIKNFSLIGVNEIGVRDSIYDGNALTGNPSSALQRFGFFENDNAAINRIQSVRNTYGINKAKNVDYKYFVADNSTEVKDKVLLLTSSSNINQSIAAYDYIDVFVWTPTAGTPTLNLVTSPRNWGIGQRIKVVNNGTVNFTVTNTSTVFTPGQSADFVSYNGIGFYKI